MILEPQLSGFRYRRIICTDSPRPFGGFDTMDHYVDCLIAFNLDMAYRERT